MKILIIMGYYVVWVGKEPGIYDNWTDCRNQIHQFKGAVYKKYPSLGEAKEAICNQPPHAPWAEPPSRWKHATKHEGASSMSVNLTVQDGDKTNEYSEQWALACGEILSILTHHNWLIYKVERQENLRESSTTEDHASTSKSIDRELLFCLPHLCYKE